MSHGVGKQDNPVPFDLDHTSRDLKSDLGALVISNEYRPGIKGGYYWCVVLQDLEGALPARHSHRAYLAGIDVPVRCYDFNFHVCSGLKLPVLCKQFFALGDGILDGTHEHEGSFRILVHSSVNYHIEAPDGIFNGDKRSGYVGKLFGNVERL